IMDYSYVYDAAGRVTSKTTEDGNYSFAYDELDQLVGITPPAALQFSVSNPAGLPVERYTYDGVNNRLTSAQLPGPWSYGADNELLTAGQGVDAITFQYNPNGHASQRTASGIDRTFEYDAAERMVGVRDNGVLVATYYYDPFGRRLAKTIGATTTY